MGIDFRVLGPLEVVEDGVSLRLGGPRPRALLAALLVETDRFISRDRLIDELWGDEPPATAENALQAQVAALRRLLPGRIVTGGAAGLGEAIAHRLGDEGAAVVVADLDGPGAERVAAAITTAGGRAVGVVCDVTQPAQIAEAVHVATTLGPLRTLVLSAAVESFQSVLDCSDGDWQHTLDVNLKGPFLCMRAAIPVIAANGGGSVIAMGSTLGLIVAPGHPAYCASKGALVNLCKQAAIEHAPDGVRVNVVAPSATDTGLFIRFSEQAPDPEGLRRRIAETNPMGRLGTAQEVCDAVMFLASDQSTYTSGSVIPIDGALAARRM